MSRTIFFVFIALWYYTVNLYPLIDPTYKQKKQLITYNYFLLIIIKFRLLIANCLFV